MFHRNKKHAPSKSNEITKVSKESIPIDKINLNELLNNHINSQTKNIINNSNDLELESQNTVDITSNMDDVRNDRSPNNSNNIQTELENGNKHQKISFNNLKFEMDHLIDKERGITEGNNIKENNIESNNIMNQDKCKLDMNDILN